MSAMQFKAVWPILGMADPELLEEIKFAHVFADGNAVLLQTTDDEVYTYGNDAKKYGFLGQGQGVHNILQPKKIEVLSKKGIQVIAFGSSGFVVAATTNSEIYTWGYGANYNLGNGGNGNVSVPAAINAKLGGNRVSKIACGYCHTLILTSTGQVFSCGLNDHGQLGQSVIVERPGLISSTLGGKFVVDIACSMNSSYAILDNGELYGWGNNDYGGIGIQKEGGDVAEPRLVTSLRNVVIKQIVCGQHHFLALTRAGEIISCGYNNHGQLGNGSTTNSPKAISISKKLGSFSQVAATHYSNLSAALSDEGIVYVWGFCRYQAVTSPMKTELSSLDDAFVCYSSPAVSWRPLPTVTAIPHGYNGDVLESLKNSLSEGEGMKDVTFIVENKKITAHKTILMIRSEYFRKMFQSEWAENEKEAISIKDFTYDGLTTFIEYVYTGNLTGNPKFNVLVDLLQVADSYQEGKLKTMCEEALRDQILVDNCAYLYVVARKCQAKVLEVDCAKFGAHNMTAVIATDHFQQMSDPTIIQEFLAKTAQYGAFKY